MNENNNGIVKDEPVIPAQENPAGNGNPPETPAPGNATPPDQLLKSLQEEREKRRILEEEKKILEEKLAKIPPPSDAEIFSDEGKALESKISALNSELSELRKESTRKDILIAYPVLKEKQTEFDEFCANPENKGMNLRTAAKAFLVENGLLDAPRKGLERQTGGDRKPLSGSMTAEDVKHLRETNYPKYRDMVEKGQIKIG